MITTFEQYDIEIIEHATGFRLHRYHSTTNARDECSAKTFSEAQSIARSAITDGHRVLMYAITKEGQSTLVTKARWA